MGREWGQEGNECPIRETLGRMVIVIPTSVAGREGAVKLAGVWKEEECRKRE
jgi:hypothetical protein